MTYGARGKVTCEEHDHCLAGVSSLIRSKRDLQRQYRPLNSTTPFAAQTF